MRFLSLAVFVSACGSAQPTPAPTPEPEPAAVTPDAAPVAAVEPDASPPAITADQIVGAWSSGGDFEEIDLQADGTFSTFLHERPFSTGTWTLEGDTLTLNAEGFDPLVLTGVRRNDDVLITVEGNVASMWKRIGD